jgi:glycerate dehydrogenase
MLSKLLLIDFDETSFDKKYLNRLKSLFSTVDFTKSDDSLRMQKIQDAEAILVQISTKIDKQLIDAAPKLKYIGVQATAFNAIDAVYAKTKGITVCNLGGYSTEAVSEFFYAALLDYLRELERARKQAKEENLEFLSFSGMELKGKTLGVVGAGKIGGRIAQIGMGFGMNVLYFSRENKPELEKNGAKKVELDDLLSQSDIVSLNLLLNKETEKIISKEKIALLKNGAIFISLAPPSLLDQEAMVEAASTGKVTFIFDHSDDINNDLLKKILSAKNVITYPPTAFRTNEAGAARWDILVKNVEQFVSGNPQNVVN